MEDRLRKVLSRVTTLAFITLAAFAASQTLLARPTAAAQSAKEPSYEYMYLVDEDGNVQVTTRFLDPNLEKASSWLIVPAYAEWQTNTSSPLQSSELQPVVSGGVTDPFWVNYSFTYPQRSEAFTLTVSFNVTQYAFIIEPNGFFLSSQIEFEPSAKTTVTVELPAMTRVTSSNVKLIDYTRGNVAAPSDLSIRTISDGRLRITGSATPNSRLAVSLTLPGKTAEFETLTVGQFTSETPKRYESRTRAILELYNSSYPILSSVFNVELETVSFSFFVPTINQFLSGLGGYLPFTPEGQPGSATVNMFYYRTVEGSIELIALHELAHYFIWATGMPSDKLWVHEGMAQYASIEVAKLLGYQRAAEEQERSLNARAQTLDGDLGFVQGWTQDDSPADIGMSYAASYAIFKMLGDTYGGLSFYEREFKALGNFTSLQDDSVIVTALGIAAENGTVVVEKFRSWGFTNIVDVAQLEALFGYAETLVPGLNPLLQPYSALSQRALIWAQNAYNNGKYSRAHSYLNTSVFCAENALPLTLFTYVGLAATVAGLYWLRSQPPRRRLTPSYRRPIPPTYPYARVRFCYGCGTRLPMEAVYCPECGRRRLQTTP